MKKYPRSSALYERSIRLIPGGVNSPVRACRSVNGQPLFIDRADGSRIYDADGNVYIDYVGSWGPMILGHRHPAVVEAIIRALERGASFGAPTDLEAEMAELIIDALPGVEMVRMVNSGTEAAMSAIRLARGFTGRNMIVKFDGCYHGHADLLLIDAGSGVATLGIPGSPGVPDAVVRDTVSLGYNDIEGFRRFMDERGGRVAAVIVEPVAGNMGLVKPVEGFLETLRELTAGNGSVLIFDEVMTGFRVAYGGAQTLYGITPDMTCLAKVIGGGLPVGAYGGKREIMEQMAPQGPVYQAGTLSGNPLAMAAGIATLKVLKSPTIYPDLERKAGALADGLKNVARQTGLPVQVDHAGSMLGMFFSDQPVHSFADAKKSDLERFAAYFHDMREKGIYLAPSQFEAFFLSAVHTDEDIRETVEAAGAVFAGL